MTSAKASEKVGRKASAGPGRPSSKRAAAIDRAIIETANRHFRALGYDGMALEGVAAEAGISKGTLYARHKSKEALFLAVWQDAVSRWSAAASQNDHTLSTDLRQRLTHHAATIVDSLRDPEVRDFQALILANADRFPDIAAQIHEIGHRYIVGLVAQDITNAARQEGREPRDVMSVATAFVSAITGWLLQAGTVELPPRDKALTYAQRVVDLVLAAKAEW